MIIYPEDVKDYLYIQGRNTTSMKAGQGVTSLIDYPDHFVSDEKKRGKTYIKTTLDYYEQIAKDTYRYNYKTFKGNYDLINGIISAKDLYQEVKDEINSSSDGLVDFLNSYEGLKEKYDRDLPDNVQNYSIMTQPINTIIGEASKRPDLSRPKAVDDDSKSEMAQFITSVMEEFIANKIRQKIIAQFDASGQKMTDEEQQKIEDMTASQMEERIQGYTSVTEKWAAVMIEACKIEFNMKEKAEIALKDLLTSSREYFIVKETNTKTGLTCENLNPLSVWSFLPKDEKYTINAYACGYITEMSMNEVIREFNLTEEEIKVLIDDMNGNEIRLGKNTNIFSSHYIPVQEDPLRFPMATEVIDPPTNYINTNREMKLSPVDRKLRTFTVSISYWEAFKKIGKLTYLESPSPDEEQEIDPETGEPVMREVTKLVDENYKDGDHPNQISLEWTYDTQLYYGYKIGNYIYNCEEFTLLPYMPIIGVIHNARNSQAKCFVDMMKPFQAFYNLMINQMWTIAEKEYGMQVVGNIRHIPGYDDGDNADAVEDFKLQMLEDSLLLVDNSVKNTKIQTQNTQPFTQIDLSRHNELQSRIALAQMIKEEALALVGINRQRLGTVLASDTVGATNTATSQSYAQTEPIFIQHEYVLNQVYQAIIDAAIYVISNNPASTLSFINDEGDSVFFKILPEQLSGKDIKLFFTSRGKDNETFNAIRQLAQPYLQGGGDLYDVAVMYDTSSVRVMKDFYKKLKEKKQEIEQQQQQLQQQQIQVQQQAAQQQLEQEERHHQENLQMEKYKIDTEAYTQIRKQEIATYFQDPGGDYNNNGIPDPTEIADQALRRQQFLSDQYNQQEDRKLKQSQEAIKQNIQREQLDIQREKLQVDREKIKSQERVAKENRNRYDK